VSTMPQSYQAYIRMILDVSRTAPQYFMIMTRDTC
jgi:hypothetical protein